MSKARGLADLGNVYSDGALSNRNKAINGAMTINQRNAGVVSVTSSGAFYAVDRFRMSGSVSTGVWSGEQSSDAPAGFSKSLKLTVTTAAATAANKTNYVVHSFEGNNVSDLNFGSSDAQTITVSFWAKSSVTGSFGGSCVNEAITRSYPFSYTIAVANTWEHKTVAIVGETTGTWATDNGIGISIYWGLGIGVVRTGTADQWNSAFQMAATGSVDWASNAGATFNITGVQLEAGPATPFEHRSFDQEHTLCQRYFQRYGGGDTSGIFAIGGWASSSVAEVTVSFVHEMRVPPTVTSPQLGRCLDVNVAWNNVTSIATIAQNSTKSTTLRVNTQTGTAAQGDSAQLGGGGNTFDYLFDSEL